MRKLIAILTVLVLGAGVVQAATQNNVYEGNANDSDFNNAANWWNPVTANDVAFFRGDNIAANPGRANVNLSAPTTISGINYEGSFLASAAYNIGGANTLTIDGNSEGRTSLIDVFGAVTANQTISADLVFSSVNNANNQHIKTGSGAGLVLSGTVSQTAGSNGLGIFVGNGDIELSGNVNGSSKLWKVRDNGGGTGVLKLTGSGVWSGFGSMQIDNNAELLLNRFTTDSTAFGAGVLQILDGGTLSLGNDEQMFDSLTVNLGSGSFNLDGNTETINGLKFLAADDSASIDMGLGGMLSLANQDNAATWGALNVLNWAEGSDTIFVDGGSFSAGQLAGITFDGFSSGAQVLDGKLIPSAIPEPGTMGLIAFCSVGILGLRRLMI